ncbi:MAG: SDR family NAD(P)-dependent oxidoreductase [Gammaproteobacteria bacterium]|nr:SDR family NAD(P)-dependent oxidoreductase [Gammaproteobacteria bacterium]
MVNNFREAGHEAIISSDYISNADVVISLLGLNSLSTIDQAKHIQTLNFQLARKIATEKIQGYIVVEGIDGYLGLKNDNESKAYLGGCAGLLKTAAQEWKVEYLKLIDIDVTDVDEAISASRLYNEITQGADSLEVGIANNGLRFIPNLSTNPIESIDKARISKDSVIIASGGGRGVTASCILALAREIPCTFILLGRTKPIVIDDIYKGIDDELMLKKKLIELALKEGQTITPKEINQLLQKIIASKEINNTLTQLRLLGATAEYVICDINSFDNVSSVCEQIRKKYGRIDGLLHGAGILIDKLIKDKNDEQFNMVFSTKVDGYNNLLKATHNDSLKLNVIFSSVAARFGNRGQVDYSMANETLNKIAQYEQRQRGEECLVKAINWGPWQGGMVNETLKKMFISRGVCPIPIEEGVKAFVNEIFDTRFDHVEVVIASKMGTHYV